MALMYKYRNISSRNHIHFSDGVLLDPGEEDWTHQKVEGHPSLELLETKDDGTVDGVSKSEIAKYVDEYLAENLGDLVQAYLNEHTGPVGGEGMDDSGEDN